MFFTVLSIELSKIFSKGRSYIGFGAITVLVPIVQAAMYSEGEAYFSLFTQGLQQQFSFTGTFLNGYLIAFVVLQSLLVHVPLLVTLVAGDMLAGENTLYPASFKIYNRISEIFRCTTLYNRLNSLDVNFINGTKLTHFWSRGIIHCFECNYSITQR